jgi:hypothetical protein
MSFSALCLLVVAASALADPPSFRKGMWEFKRTVEGQSTGGKPATLC